MSEFILIAIVSMVYLGKPAVTSQAVMFPTQEACEGAKAALMAIQSKDNPYYVRAVCVPRGTP
jgi:hypothetical protein